MSIFSIVPPSIHHQLLQLHISFLLLFFPSLSFLFFISPPVCSTTVFRWMIASLSQSNCILSTAAAQSLDIRNFEQEVLYSIQYMYLKKNDRKCFLDTCIIIANTYRHFYLLNYIIELKVKFDYF